MVVEASKRPKMTAVDNITSLRQRREAIVRQHAEAENRHDVEATIALAVELVTWMVEGNPSDGGEAVRELLQGFMHGFPDFHIEPTRLRHLDDGVLVEGLMTGTHDGEWASMRPTGRRIEVPVVGIFKFDADRLLCEKVHLDMAKVLKQIGVLPAVS